MEPTKAKAKGGRPALWGSRSIGFTIRLPELINDAVQAAATRRGLDRETHCIAVLGDHLGVHLPTAADQRRLGDNGLTLQAVARGRNLPASLPSAQWKPWGARKAFNLRLPDHVLPLLDTAAAEAGMPRARYAIVVLAEAHGVPLQKSNLEDLGRQLPLAIGA